MEKPTTDELRLIVEKRSIKNYQNMSRKKLLKSIDKSKLSFKNISQNGLKRIAKMRNFSQNEREQNIRMKSLPQNELANIRHIKNYEKLSKEGLLMLF